MNKENNKFLGTEKVSKLLKMFAIPCVLSLIIQALYNIVDQIFIGNCESLGQFGNTATGIVYPLTVIALAIGLWLGDGAAASISLNQGRNDTKNTHKSIGTSITIGLIVSVLFLIFSFIFKTDIIRAFGASDIIFNYASEYANWIIAGFPFFIITCILNPIIRADGSPKYAMISMAIGAVVNIILDPIFIFQLNMGMTGAALATFIAQFIAFIVSVCYFKNSKSFKLNVSSFVPDFNALSTSLKLGISSCLTQVSIVIISIVNNNILLKYMPSDFSAVGLLTIAFKVFGIVVSIIVGISCGGQPIIGYNYGAKKYERVKETYKYILFTSIIIGIIATITFMLFPSSIFKLFGYSTVSTFGLDTFKIYMSCILFTCLIKATAIFFQSVGHPVKATILTMLRDLIILVPLAIILPAIGGIDLFLWSAPISDTITLIFMIIFIVLFMSKLRVNSTEEVIIAPQIIKSHKGVIITVSREHGAGGREIALKLANELKIPFYDKEIGSYIANETGMSSEYINDIENNSTVVRSLYLGLEVNQMVVNAQTELLKKIAENGSCVILGRAADYVLKDYDLCKIFIHAPIDYKIKRIVKNYGDNKKEALKNIEISNKKRAKFYEDFSGQAWGKSSNYSLCLDSSIGIDRSVTVIKEYIG